ncbi:MAG: hypothetical protein A3H93_19475 [Rhodocyclales bacterium RIFCSPLOWO2_02_FULL_63_24]|nr:MAG: hypothetical protein A2040_11430 [Rhodocyclales bacterium GWA2_65_19]OHC70980.1 MAG: hypothetical protein A3H93_19475 [Rhodocyclales bacterium RIFCSPLOWO2_02_FULL_63_24]
MNRVAKTAIVIAAMVLGVSGQVWAQAAVTAEGGRVQLTFMDSKLFDGRLSKEMEGRRDVIDVEVVGKVSLSSIPTRMDKWIAAVGENGQVELKPAERTRSIFALIPAVFSFLKQINEERMLAQAKDYNAVIYYRKDDTGDSTIERIVFRRKPQ